MVIAKHCEKTFNQMVDNPPRITLLFNRMVESSAARLDSVFHALADPTRRAILHGLTHGERTVTEIARPHRMTLAAVSKHLKVLESAELVARERRGSFHIVRLQAQSLKAAEEWIAFYSRFWNQNLDNLEKYLEGES
jgi:DNA-binding transcriptional ArsR family regulator